MDSLSKHISLEFINTTNTLNIDHKSRWLIRKQASCHTARSNKHITGDTVAQPGTKSRLRLGPTGLNDSPKRVRRVGLKVTRDQKPETESLLPDHRDLRPSKAKAHTTLKPRRGGRSDPDDRSRRQQDSRLQDLLKSLETSIHYAPNTGAW